MAGSNAIQSTESRIWHCVFCYASQRLCLPASEREKNGAYSLHLSTSFTFTSSISMEKCKRAIVGLQLMRLPNKKNEHYNAHKHTLTHAQTAEWEEEAICVHTHTHNGKKSLYFFVCLFLRLHSSVNFIVMSALEFIRDERSFARSFVPCFERRLYNIITAMG